MQEWNSKFYKENNSFLIYEIDENGCYEFLDTRDGGASRFSLDLVCSKIYRTLDKKIRGIKSIKREFLGEYSNPLIDKSIQSLKERKIVFEDGEMLVNEHSFWNLERGVYAIGQLK